MNTEKKYNEKIGASITIQTCATDPFYFLFLSTFTCGVHVCKFGEKNIKHFRTRHERLPVGYTTCLSLKLHNNQDFKNIPN